MLSVWFDLLIANIHCKVKGPVTSRQFFTPPLPIPPPPSCQNKEKFPLTLKKLSLFCFSKEVPGFCLFVFSYFKSSLTGQSYLKLCLASLVNSNANTRHSSQLGKSHPKVYGSQVST